MSKVAYIHGLYADRGDPTCRSRYIAVVLHPDAEHLRRRARKQAPHQSWDGVDGCFHPAPFHERYDDKAGKWADSTPPFAGTMRLHLGRLDGEVVGHEAVHAALHIWRLHQWFKGDPTTTADLGGECGPVEEAFAYLLGGITGSLSNLVPAMTADIEEIR